jgi:SAM-dependent methyltransferase
MNSSGISWPEHLEQAAGHSKVGPSARECEGELANRNSPSSKGEADSQREAIRLHEASQALRFFPKEGTILEIGAGAGWQARFFTERGYRVSAIDIASSIHLKNAVFPVSVYDGRIIPFPDKSFDVVFSSNVLEHIPHVLAFQQEIRRVSRPGGRIVHVMPTATWRLWTIVSHYPWKTLGQKLRAAFIPAPHGANANCLVELYRFSRFRWLKLFREAGFPDVHCYPNRLFYAGHRVLGSFLPIGARQILSRVFGSACLIYVMENREAA